jgi:uncharacterized repeat protein (TIGR01451 family)
MAAPGERFTYTINLTNRGNGSAANITLNDTLAEGLEYVNATGAVTVSNRTLLWSWAELPANGSAGLEVQVAVAAGVVDGVVLPNTALCNYTDLKGLKAWNVSSEMVLVYAAAPVLSLSKAVNRSSVRPGEEVQFNISLENRGHGAARDLKITETLPPQLEFVSAVPVPTETLVWRVSTLGTGWYNITLNTRVAAGAVGGANLTNLVEVNASTTGGVALPGIRAWASVPVENVSGPIDTTPPYIVTHTPAKGATGVPTKTVITVTFSEEMCKSAMELAFRTGPSANGTKSWNANGTVLTFTPASKLKEGVSYTVIIDTNAKDLAGNAMAAQYSWSFTTAKKAAPPPAADLFAYLGMAMVAIIAVGLIAMLILSRPRDKDGEKGKAGGKGDGETDEAGQEGKKEAGEKEAESDQGMKDLGMADGKDEGGPKPEDVLGMAGGMMEPEKEGPKERPKEESKAEPGKGEEKEKGNKEKKEESGMKEAGGKPAEVKKEEVKEPPAKEEVKEPPKKEEPKKDMDLDDIMASLKG